MADWTDPPWAQLTAGKAWTDEKAAAAFENPIAITEGAPGSPYEYAVWRPWDSAVWGDGNNGLIFDFATTGTVSQITTPDFEAGWDYQLLISSLTITANAPISLEVYSGGGWSATKELMASAGGGARRVGYVDFSAPGTLQYLHLIPALLGTESSGTDGWQTDVNPQMFRFRRFTPAAILRARLGGANFNGGQVQLRRRRTNGPVIRA